MGQAQPPFWFLGRPSQPPKSMRIEQIHAASTRNTGLSAAFADQRAVDHFGFAVEHRLGVALARAPLVRSASASQAVDPCRRQLTPSLSSSTCDMAGIPSSTRPARGTRAGERASSAASKLGPTSIALPPIFRSTRIRHVHASKRIADPDPGMEQTNRAGLLLPGSRRCEGDHRPMQFFLHPSIRPGRPRRMPFRSNRLISMGGSSSLSPSSVQRRTCSSSTISVARPRRAPA